MTCSAAASCRLTADTGQLVQLSRDVTQVSRGQGGGPATPRPPTDLKMPHVSGGGGELQNRPHSKVQKPVKHQPVSAVQESSLLQKLK